MEEDLLHDDSMQEKRERTRWKKLLGRRERENAITGRFRYEELASWLAEVWKAVHPDIPYTITWSYDESGNTHVHRELTTGIEFGSTTFQSVESVSGCPLVAEPIYDYTMRHDGPQLENTAGAYWFHFEHFDALYAVIHNDPEDPSTMIALAAHPPERLNDWIEFGKLCNKKARHLDRTEDVYVIGGTMGHFKPNVEWEDVVLSEEFKNDLANDMEAFFDKGVEIYTKLNLPPFRKLLLVGPPGTGKTMLCAAMAKRALEKGRIVVYVSGSDPDGPVFYKIHRALSIVANSAEPVLLIVEEFDIYLEEKHKAQILNVLDGMETPHNPMGALMIATTNYPEKIDHRIAKRPGRLDRILVVPPIETLELAEKMLRHYMGEQWQDSHQKIVERLVDETGAFVREMAIQARMMAAHSFREDVPFDLLEKSWNTLKNQLDAADDLVPKTKKRPWSFQPIRNGFRQQPDE